MSLDQFESLLNLLHEPILICSKDKKITYVNYAAATFFQISPRMLRSGLDLKHIFVLPGTEQSFNFDILDESLKTNDPQVSGEIHLALAKFPDISFFFVLKAFTSSSENNDKQVICFRDLTVEKNLYNKYKNQIKELEEGHAQIIQADKLATIGEMTASLSHEISNPLTIAAGNIEVALALLDPTPELSQIDIVTKCVRDANESLSVIGHILSDLKGFLHKSEEKREYVDLKILAQDIISLLGPEIRQNKVSLQPKFSDTEIVAFINPTKIRQVMMNLIKNAIDALAEVQPKEGRKIFLHLEKDQSLGHLFLKVVDNGPGIPEKSREQIFVPFYTTKKIGEGTGLGLPICQKIVTAFGGKIWPEETPGGGCTFIVQFPGIEVSAYSYNERYLSGLSDKQGIKILVINDEPQVLNVLNHMIGRQEDFVFIGSTSVADAEKIIEKFDVDIVLTDIKIPSRSGIEMAKSFSNNPQSPKFILMSGGVVEEEMKKIHGLKNVAGFLQKPFEESILIDTLRSALKGGRQS